VPLGVVKKKFLNEYPLVLQLLPVEKMMKGQVKVEAFELNYYLLVENDELLFHHQNNSFLHYGNRKVMYFFQLCNPVEVCFFHYGNQVFVKFVHYCKQVCFFHYDIQLEVEHKNYLVDQILNEID
jgi:hypothetical protein